MSESTVKLQPIKLKLDKLLLDPNNPRFAKSLNLREKVADLEVSTVQKELEALFVNEDAPNSGVDDDDEHAEEGKVRFGDLVQSMTDIGFVPIDRVVVRELQGVSGYYVVIEGNRRVRAAKWLAFNYAQLAPTEREDLEGAVKTLQEIDCLQLDSHGLTAAELHDQIGVILGLRHFGQLLPWGPLAKAVNIYTEYMSIEPALTEFVLDTQRVTKVQMRLSQTRAGVLSALKTYVAYRQLQEMMPHAQPKPQHYSLLQACIINSKLRTAEFVAQDPSTFQLSAACMEKLGPACEFQARDALAEDAKILRDPKAVGRFAGLVADAASHPNSAIRAFAASLRDDVLRKERTLDDAVDNLRSFKSELSWTESLAALLAKVVEPDAPPEMASAIEGPARLSLSEFEPVGNERMRLDVVQKTFRNLRIILGI